MDLFAKMHADESMERVKAAKEMGLYVEIYNEDRTGGLPY